jgi:hypothetical protein
MNQISIWMKNGGERFEVLNTMVRGIAEIHGAIRDDFDSATTQLQPAENAHMSVENGVGVLTATDDGVAAFSSGTLTLDLDKYPYLDLNVLSLEGSMAIKIYEVGSSPFGTYILPQIPLVPELPVKGPMRIHLKERTGWSGIHTFKIGIYIVGKKGDTLRLESWGLSPQ